VNRRLERQNDRGDIWSLVIRQNKDNVLSLGEMQATGVSFMTAGTETTATALSGVTYYLLTNPEKLEKLTTEIRTAFAAEEEMSILALARLLYLQACFNEALRMYPPVPGGPPRVAPSSGGFVCGERLPPGVSIASMLFDTHTTDNALDNVLFQFVRGLSLAPPLQGS
jgi:cytochrome P450